MRKHTRPRTRTRPSDWWVASVTALPARAPRANGPVRPKDVPASADGRKRRCASLDDRSAHRTPMSFARSGTALSRSVACRQTRLRRVAPLPALPPLSRPDSVGRQTCLQDETALRRSKAGGGTEVSPLAGRPTGPYNPRHALRLRWCSSFNGAPSRFRGLRPLDPGQVCAPDGACGLQAVARLANALAAVAVPGRVRRPHWALRFRNGRGRSGHSDALMAFPQGISGSGATPEGGWDGRVRPHPPRCPHWASKVGGRSQPRPEGPVRHRRIGRPWPNHQAASALRHMPRVTFESEFCVR